jgi:hypothetical protein
MTDFQSASESDASIMLLVGVAGVGKSAMAWDLWKRLRTKAEQQDRHLFWYSFYDGRGSGSFQGLIDELSDFLGLRDSKGTTSIASSDTIIDSLSTVETVLFLDGIERCLRCYQRPLAVGDLAAAEIQQRNVNDWSMQDLAFASDEMFRFFTQLAELPKCRVIATSRVVPSDFFASGGGLRAGVLSRVVGGLDATETLHLLNAVGLSIGGPDAATVAGTFGGHPLALQLFARQASRSVSARRDVSTWLLREGYSLSVGHGPAKVRARLFAAAAVRLSPDSRIALAATGAVGGVLDLPSLQEIMPSPTSDERVHQIIEEVAASGLGLATPDGLACHPLTASAAADQLTRTQTEQLVEAIGVSLRRRFKDLHSGEGGYFKWFTTGNVADRSEAMALCRALVRLSKWAEAAEVYVDQLDLPVRLVLGANFDAIELLQQLISGMESLSEKDIAQIGTLRSRLAYHLLMTGQIKQADILLASLEESGPLGHTTYCIASEVALHLGDSVKALRLATIALHEARGRLYYAYGYNHTDWGLITFDLVLPPRGGPSADFIESVTLCSRVLIHEGYLAEAALLISEGLRVRREDHPSCDGCHGLLLRNTAELLLASGDHFGAGEVANYGKNLQESQGKALQGLFSDVIVIAGLCKISLTPPSHDLVKFLGDTGFVLYQLILDAVAGADQSGSVQSERAIRELEQIEAKFALKRIISGQHDEVPSELSAEQVGQCVAWLIDDRAIRKVNGEHQQMVYWPGHEPSDELKLLDEVIASKLDSLIRLQYPARLLTKVARRVQAADRGTSRAFPDLPELRVALPSIHRLRALRQAQAGNHEDHIAALITARSLSLYNIDTLSKLASAMVKEEHFEAAAEYLQSLLKTTSYYDIYDFAVTLVTSRGILADQVRKCLIELAEDHHESCGAYLALANLERRIRDEKAARRWHKKGLDYPTDTTATEEHRLAHIFGSQGRTRFISALSLYFRNRSFFSLSREKPPFGLSLEEYRVVAYLLHAVIRPEPVQNPGEITYIGASAEISEDFFKAAQGFIISECSLLHVIGPGIVEALKAKFQLDTD